jgi:hypothetical protein
LLGKTIKLSSLYGFDEGFAAVEAYQFHLSCTPGRLQGAKHASSSRFIGAKDAIHFRKAVL